MRLRHWPATVCAISSFFAYRPMGGSGGNPELGARVGNSLLHAPSWKGERWSRLLVRPLLVARLRRARTANWAHSSPEFLAGNGIKDIPAYFGVSAKSLR